MFKIYIKCSWCGKDMGSKATNIKQEPAWISHTAYARNALKLK